MARPRDSSGSVAPPCYLTAVHQPVRLWRGLTVGLRESDAAREMKPMRRYLRPRLELANTDTSLDLPTSMRTVDSHHSVDDQLGLKRRLEAELGHVLNEFWRGLESVLTTFSPKHFSRFCSTGRSALKTHGKALQSRSPETRQSTH